MLVIRNRDRNRDRDRNRTWDLGSGTWVLGPGLLDPGSRYPGPVPPIHPLTYSPIHPFTDSVLLLVARSTGWQRGGAARAAGPRERAIQSHGLCGFSGPRPADAAYDIIQSGVMPPHKTVNSKR